MNRIYLPLILLLLTTSCSTFRKAALGAATPMFFKSSKGFEKEPHWESFQAGIPANLKLIDGLLEIRPEDPNLLVPAIKGYSGYAFSIHETLYLDDQLADKFNSEHKKSALAYYTKAFGYGLRFLQSEGIEWDTLKNWSQAGTLQKEFDSEISDSLLYLEGVLFTAQSLASMINLQRDNIALISLLPVAKSMFDWVCEKEPEIANGVCPLFYASYEAGRPAMLGGNPEKGKAIFEKLIKENPHNWLARVAFIQYYIIPMLDEDLYRSQKVVMEGLENKHSRLLRWGPKHSELNASLGREDLRLYQAVAIKRYQIIKKYEEDLF